MTSEAQTRLSSESSEVTNPDAVMIDRADLTLTSDIEKKMKLPSTAVVIFFMEADEFSTVDQVVEVVEHYKQQSTAHKEKDSCKCGQVLCADYRKIFWCTAMNKWKAVNFYFDTDSLIAHQHGYNRELLEPYMGKGYICSGATDGNHFNEEQSRLAGCIKLCDVPSNADAVYYHEVIMDIACELQKVIN